MKKLFIIFFAFILSVLITGCGSESGDKGGPETDPAGGSTIGLSEYTASVAGTADSYDADDLVSNTVFAYSITVDLTASTVQLDSGSAQTFSTSASVTPIDGVTISRTSTGVSITNTSATIIRYILRGTLSGNLAVDSDSASYQLYLEGVSVSGGSTGPALCLASSTKAFIVFADGTTNTLSDLSTRSSGKKAALYGSGPMIFSGTGTLSVSGNYKHAVYCEDYIRIRGGEMNVSVTAKNAIQSVHGFIFDDGYLTISATGTKTDDESKGIRVEGEESSAGADRGYIYVNGGTISITSVGKAITAGWDIDDDAETFSTGDDPDPFVVINNGVINIKTTGTPYEYQTVVDGEISTVSCSPEGIEGKSSLTINSGYIIISTTDDCLNAGLDITINGGYVYARASDNDAIDSNGTLAITGGTVVAIGASEPEGPFDCDNNRFSITGGILVGIGGTISKPTAAECTQNILVLGSPNISLTKGSVLALVANGDTSGGAIFSFEIPQNAYTMIISTPDINYATYDIYTGVTASADEDFYGLYLDNISCSGGSKKETITISSNLTKLGGKYFN